MNANSGLLAVIVVILLAGSAAAADFDIIEKGGSFYIGDIGLNVTHALNQAQGTDPDGEPPLTSIGWWASPADIFVTSPSRSLSLADDYRAMTASPERFSGYSGNWYLLAESGTEPFSGDALVFSVLDHTPAAGFFADSTTGTAPLTVTFTDSSTGYPTEWLWDFGDGSAVNATDRNPVHTYADPGTYDVSLTATNSAGSDTHTATDYITVDPPPPVADFSGSPRSATAPPLTVTFTDTSTGDPTGWLWDFGDGSTVNATHQNPVHTYADPGTYDVSLTVTNAGGSDTHTETAYITVDTPPPVADFTGSPRSGPAPLTVLFHDDSASYPAGWEWDFGDGSAVNATRRNPVHTYADPGTYDVSLTVTNAGGSDTHTETDYITVFAPPVVSSISPRAGPVAGSTFVAIDGTGFTGASEVLFGDTAGTGMTVVSANHITVRSPAHAAGTVYVTVSTPNGTSAPVTAARFTFSPRPTVTDIIPDAGPTGGGTLVTITGSGFTGATAVLFGGSSGTGITVVSPAEITVRSPAHAAGTVDVTVTTPGGTSLPVTADRFTFAPPPTVTDITPDTGPAAGGTLVTVDGTGFSGATSVLFGDSAGSGMTVLSPTRITVRSPAHAAGTVDVTVTTPGGTSAPAPAARFTYSPQPSVTALSPAAGPVAGGTPVNITGTGFMGATAVMFGNTAGSGMTVLSAEEITVRSPAHAAGTVDVTVTTPNGTSAPAAAARFRFAGRPTVTALSPTGGPVAGRTLVIINGTGFTGATAVRFGDTAATNLTVVSAGRITVRSPAHPAGTANVTVTTPGGTSANSSANRFTWAPRPAVTALLPAAGPVAGRTLVTIIGTGLSGATAVRFGDTAATNLTVVSAGRITVRSPAHPAGTANVTVTTPGGKNANTTANRFTWAPRPTVTGIVPENGTVAGGTLVTITGTGFSGAKTVRFGGTAGTSLTVLSATRITVRSPAHATENVNVTVTTMGGTSANSSANRYAYVIVPAGTIANHTGIHLGKIPVSAILAAKSTLHIAYGHTASHGSQIPSGMTGLTTFSRAPYGGSTYSANSGGVSGALDFREPWGNMYDLGSPNRRVWANQTRIYLNAHPEVNVLMWSWGDQVDGTPADISLYLNLMNELEGEFPDVKFVYMTGHLTGTGAAGTVNLRNEQIRGYVQAHDKILYDFADIESFDPDGNTNYMLLNATDTCDYDGGRNWARDWQNTHIPNVDWYNCIAANTQPLNANQKAYAAWWLWARLAGWDGTPVPAASSIGVFRPADGSFLLKSGAGTTTIDFGLAPDLPVTGDWNGDGTWDVGVYHPANGTFLLRNGTTTTAIRFGLASDLPVTGDWNGDGLWDVGVFRPSTSTFSLRNGTRTITIGFGQEGDLPVTGDWNGDGKWDVGVFRNTTRQFILKRGAANTTLTYGLTTDLPVTGDWNGDRKWDIGVYRSATHRFLLRNGTQTIIVPWGAGTDRPVSGKWE